MSKQITVNAFGKKFNFPEGTSIEEIESTLNDNEHVLNPDWKQPEGLSGLAKNVLTGAKQTGRMVGATVDAASNNLSGVENYAKESQVSAQQNMPVEQRKLIGELSEINRDQGALSQIGDTLKAAGRNPMGTGQLVAEQLPNTAVSLGGGYAGFKTGAAAGALFGPVGATIGGAIGFVGGMFLGNVLLEAGGKAIEKASDADGFTPQDRDESLREGAVKGAVITGIDAATFKVGGLIAKKLGSAAINAGAKAEAKVLIDAGVDTTSLTAINAALKSSPELFRSARIAGEKAALQSLSTGRKAGIIGAGIALETASEGIGEYAGEYAATGKGDVVDATIEALSSATMSIAETAYNYNKVAAGNDLSPEGIQKVAGQVNEFETKSGIDDISKAASVDDAIKAANKVVSRKPETKDSILKSIDPTLADIERLTGLKPSESIEVALNEEQQGLNADSISSQADTKNILSTANVEGKISQPSEGIINEEKIDQKTTTPTKSSGVLGNDSEIVLPAGATLPTKWEVVDADSISASIKEGVNQPRDRTRAASDVQVQSIAKNPDYRRLSDSPVMDIGAPVISEDGLIIAGNGRFEALSRAYEQGTSTEYLNKLKADAVNKGIDPALIEGMRKPVLVRRVTKPFDTRALAIASNSGASLQYSGLELAKIDSGRMLGIEDLDITDSGDIALTGGNIEKLKKSLVGYSPTELASMVDKDGMLSQDGVKRVRNSLLAKAYGDSETLGRMIESTDNDVRNVIGALTRSSGIVAKTRGEIKAGAIPKEVDITENFLGAVETLVQIKAKGQPIDNYLSQQDVFGDSLDDATVEILKFIDNNIRSQKKLTEFIRNVYDQISRIDQSTEDIFGDKSVPSKSEIVKSAKQRTDGEPAPIQQEIFTKPGEKSSGSIKQESKVEANNAGSGKESEQDSGLKFSRSTEERLKDRDRSRQLERLLRAGGYDFTISPMDMRDVVTLGSGTQAEAAAAERIAKIFGKRIVWIKADGPFGINGVIIPSIKDTIFIDVRTPKLVHAVMGHELSHHLERDAPEIYADMVEALKSIIVNDQGYRNKYDIPASETDANITKEIVGDIVGDNFTKPEFWNKVAEYNPNAFRKIADTVISWLKNLALKAKTRGFGSERWVTDIVKAQDIIAKAVAQYTESDVKAASTDGKAKFNADKETLHHRYTNAKTADNGLGYAMFAEDEGSVINGYGRNHYTFNIAVVPKNEIVYAGSAKLKELFLSAISKREDILDKLQTTPEALSTEINPPDITNSAGLWDNLELVSLMYDEVLEPNGWKVVETDDGSLVFDMSLVELKGGEAKFSRASQGSLFGNNDNLASQEELLKQNSARPGDLFARTNPDSVQTDAVTAKPEEEQTQESLIPEPTISKQNAPGKIDDFGQKLGGSRKDMEAALRKEYTDADIASVPLSKIWPKEEALSLEDPFMAAFAYAAREEIPTKPKLSYKVKSWVEKVKLFRSLTRLNVSGAITKDKILDFSKNYPGLENFFNKVQLLELIENRKDWSRIDSVAIYPDAYKYDAGGIKVSSPYSSFKIDGRTTISNVTDIKELAESVKGALSNDAPEKLMQFEIRGRSGDFFINKKGDKEYRALKRFTDLKEARAYWKENYDDLVAAWESVKESDNVKKSDIRGEENRPRTGQDWRNGRDITPEQFQEAFGFRGVEFGNWVSQGAGNRDRQGMLNQTYDALMDLSSLVGIPPKAISLEGTLGLGFGSRGKGAALAHFEPGNLVINLTKTKGAGNLAHEWFHALDNYFQRKRGEGKSQFITYYPERMMVHKEGKWPGKYTKATLNKRFEMTGNKNYNPDMWTLDPAHPLGVRPEIEAKFSELVQVLDDSPMKQRAEIIDKGKADGYWSRIIERAARSFENYVIAKMMKAGYNNDYLANVTNVTDFSRNPARYPYLLESEIAPVEDAFNNLFSEIKTKETEKGIAMFSRAAKEIPETINIDGIDRPTRNSEGKLIHPTEEGIRNFWKWFGESEVADEQGRPLVVYHGSSIRDIKEFNPLLARDIGVHFSESDLSKKFGGKRYDVYLKLVNPAEVLDRFSVSGADYGVYSQAVPGAFEVALDLDYDDANALRKLGAKVEKTWSDNREVINVSTKNYKKFWSEVEKLATKNRFDGFVYKNKYEGGGLSYVAFNPNQIKSAIGNNGAFSEDPDIRFSRVSKDAEKSNLPEETRFRKFQRLTQDSFNRFTVIREWLNDRGINLSEKADVYAAEERYHAKVANQLEDFREKVRNPLIEKISKAGFTLSDVTDYLEAQHAPEANAAIQKLQKDPDATAYGITEKEAKDYLAKAPVELGKLANELRSITETTKQLRLDNGLLNKDITDAWEAAYQHYIPVKGDAESARGTGKGMKVNFKTKRRLGHGKRDEAVIENILMDHERAIMEVEKNRVGKHLVMMSAEIAMPELITIGQPEKRKVLVTSTAYEVQVKGVTRAVFDSIEGARAFRQSLSLLDRNIALSSIVINPTSDQRIAASASPMLAENEVNVYMDGHAIRVQINDELLARAYTKMGVNGVSAIVAAGRALNGYLSKVYTGYNPEFIMTNMVRDFTTGIINLSGEQGAKMAAKAVSNYPSSFASLLKYAYTNGKSSNNWIDSYRANGGNTGAAYLSDMERLGNEVNSEYAAYQGVIANLKQGDMSNAARAAARKVYNATLKWIYNLNQAGENAMRLSAFKAMIDSGRSVNEAAKVAKNITVNFNRKGELGAEANAAYLFFNASMQGVAATTHALLKGKNKYQAWGLVSGMTTLAYFSAAALGGGDEDEYDKIDDFTRERNALIKHGDGWVKIPIPYGYGFFWNLGRTLADAQRKDELGTMPWHVAASAIEELTPFGDIVVGSDGEFKTDQVLLGLLPTAAKIPFQPGVNKQIFSGTELIPDSPFDQSQPDREKMWRGTKGTMYDQIAGWLEAGIGADVSPETLKYYTRTFTGGAGSLVDSTISAAMLKSEGAELEARETPFVRKVYSEVTIRETRAAYYKAKEEAKKAAEEFRRAQRNNDLVSMQAVVKDKKEMLALDAYANKLSDVIRLSRDQQDAVRLSDKFSVAEKRLKLKEMEKQESAFYDQFLDVFNTQKLIMKKMNDQYK